MGTDRLQYGAGFRMMRRFPRLSPARAKTLLAERGGLDVAQLRGLSPPVMDHEKFSATGLQRISRNDLVKIRDEVEAAAIEAGYPESSQSARQKFDRYVAVRLASMDLPSGEMLRPDVWTWLAMHLFPHLVQWRFGKEDGAISEERFLGIVQRNALGRLWLRGRIFDRGGQDGEQRWKLAEAISEDASVAILERTSLASDWRLARALGEGWLSAREKGMAADQILRRVAIKVRIKFAYSELGIFTDEALQAFISDLFASDEGEKQKEALITGEM